MKVIVFTTAAARQWQGLEGSTRKRVKAKLDRYAETGAGDVRALTGRSDARLRIGDWRVTFIETNEAITVTAVGHRSKVYDI
jgi:mRNA interferase RelE/StbE